MGISRTESRRMAGQASGMGATVIGGELVNVDGRFFINKTDVTALLEKLINQQVLLVLSDVEAESRHDETKTCLTCGRTYTQSECPYCRQVRIRLRG